MGKLMKPLERFPLPPFLSLGLILIVLAFAIIVPVYLIMKYKQEITRICKTLLKPCLLMCLPKDGADGIDLTKVKLTRRTFYERVHPAVNELEFSAGDGEFGKFGIKLGQVHFGLNYDNVKNILRIKIYEAKDLPAADEGGASDPYIRVMLLPDTKRRYETIVLDDTLDPVYNQEFAFNNLPLSELQKRKLCIRALDFDTFPQHDILGETQIPLIDLDLVKKHYTKEMIDFWRILVPGYDPDNPGEFKQSRSDYGDILVSLHYMPAVATLKVYIIECKNLKSVDEEGVSDPFVKVTMLHNKVKKKTQKTRVIKKTLDPYYNEEMTFKLDPGLAPVTDMRFLVMDYDFPIGADIIGEVVIGANSYGPQKRQWRDMMKSQKRPIACWHMLRPKMNKGEDD